MAGDLLPPFRRTAQPIETPRNANNLLRVLGATAYDILLIDPLAEGGTPC